MKIYLAEMPDCFGYGLCVIDTDRAAAIRALKRTYRDMRRSYQSSMSFDQALEYFGGGCREIEPGKVYNDGFKL